MMVSTFATAENAVKSAVGSIHCLHYISNNRELNSQVGKLLQLFPVQCPIHLTPAYQVGGAEVADCCLLQTFALDSLISQGHSWYSQCMSLLFSCCVWLFATAFEIALNKQFPSYPLIGSIIMFVYVWVCL